MRLPFVVSLAVVLAISGGASAQEKRIPIKYRSSANVYLDGGSADGLAVGDHLTVLSRGDKAAEIEVVFVSEHSASCRVISEARPVGAGDLAVLAPTVPVPLESGATVAEAPVAATPPPEVGRAPQAAVPWARARGGFSVGWYRMWDHTATAYDFEQRTARADLSLWDLWGRPYQFNLRLRSGQNIRLAPPGFEDIPRNERNDRLYEAAVRYDPRDGPFMWEAGRIGSSPVGIGYLDGGLAAYRPSSSLEVGGFFGNRPNIERYAFVPSGKKYGAFLRAANGSTYAPGDYDALVAVVREFAGAEVSREYASFQGRLAAMNGRLTSFQWAEVDLNSGWREELAGQKVQLSNLSVAVNYRVTSVFQAGLSYDQRRNYWTDDIRSLPEILFDKYLHQGLRASFDVSRPNSFGFSGSLGFRSEDQNSTSSQSFAAGFRHPRVLGLYLSVDGSGYTNPSTSGYLGSVRLGKTLKSASIDAAYGASHYTLKLQGGSRFNQWVRATGRFNLPQHLYFQGDVEYDTGDDAKGPRALLELGYRF
ncbi:MAG: hypothetical protein ACHQNV_01975 [Vicinamibacteria bacterium]